MMRCESDSLNFNADGALQDAPDEEERQEQVVAEVAEPVLVGFLPPIARFVCDNIDPQAVGHVAEALLHHAAEALQNQGIDPKTDKATKVSESLRAFVGAMKSAERVSEQSVGGATATCRTASTGGGSGGGAVVGPPSPADKAAAAASQVGRAAANLFREFKRTPSGGLSTVLSEAVSRERAASGNSDRVVAGPKLPPSHSDPGVSMTQAPMDDIGVQHSVVKPEQRRRSISAYSVLHAPAAGSAPATVGINSVDDASVAGGGAVPDIGQQLAAVMGTVANAKRKLWRRVFVERGSDARRGQRVAEVREELSRSGLFDEPQRRTTAQLLIQLHDKKHTAHCGLVFENEAEFKEHQRATCGCREVMCRHAGCGAVLAMRHVSLHESHCARRPVRCDLNGGCGCQVPFEELPEHRSKRCARRVVACPFACIGCVAAPLAGALAGHCHGPLPAPWVAALTAAAGARQCPVVLAAAPDIPSPLSLQVHAAQPSDGASGAGGSDGVIGYGGDSGSGGGDGGSSGGGGEAAEPEAARSRLQSLDFEAEESAEESASRSRLQSLDFESGTEPLVEACEAASKAAAAASAAPSCPPPRSTSPLPVATATANAPTDIISGDSSFREGSEAEVLLGDGCAEHGVHYHLLLAARTIESQGKQIAALQQMLVATRAEGRQTREALAMLEAGVLVDLNKSLREGQQQLRALDKRSEQTKGAVARVESRISSSEERIRKLAREAGV